jgi:hypothetical protein
VQHGGGGDGDLGRIARTDLAFEVLEVGELDVFDVAHLIDHAHHRWRQFHGAVGPLDSDRDVGLHPADLLQEIDVEIGAAEFAVGDAFKAHVFLEPHDFGDGLVFDFAQLFRRDLALGFLLAGLEQVLGAQKAADVVVAGG